MNRILAGIILGPQTVIFNQYLASGSPVSKNISHYTFRTYSWVLAAVTTYYNTTMIAAGMVSNDRIMKFVQEKRELYCILTTPISLQVGFTLHLFGFLINQFLIVLFPTTFINMNHERVYEWAMIFVVTTSGLIHLLVNMLAESACQSSTVLFSKIFVGIDLKNSIPSGKDLPIWFLAIVMVPFGLVGIYLGVQFIREKIRARRIGIIENEEQGNNPELFPWQKIILERLQNVKQSIRLELICSVFNELGEEEFEDMISLLNSISKLQPGQLKCVEKVTSEFLRN